MKEITRYTLFVDGEKVTTHLSELFSNSPLEQVEQTILKETHNCSNSSKGSVNDSSFIRKYLTKFFKFLFKFQKLLLVKVFQCSKSASSLHIISLCIEYDSEIAPNIPLYTTNATMLEMIQKAQNNVLSGSNVV